MPYKGQKIAYRPSQAVQKARHGVYSDIEYMIDQRNQTYRQFNDEDGDHTLIDYIDSQQKRLNGYTPTREEQDKEDWQNNVFNPVTRNKLKAVVAGVALQPPEFVFKAVNKEGVFSAQRAEAMKQLVRHSRLTENPQLDIFFEAWECAGTGTVIKYDGYLKTKFKRKFIKSYDLDSGNVEFDEREVTVDDKPIDLMVPLSEIFIWDFYIDDIQDQPKLAWIQHYNYDKLKAEFGQFKNFKYVKDANNAQKFKSTTQNHYYDKWALRVDTEDDYEVIRYYNMLEDRYEVWVNGVELLRAPLLWGHAKKMFPFSKTIFEPFEGLKFFYGKGLPSVLQGNQDIDNTVWNTMLDKLYRSLTPPMLVGMVNKDLLDIEDELVNQDNKLYVPDINQVKPMPYEGVSSGDLAMLQAVGRMMDLSSVDQNQSGQQGRGVTAREVVVANENAQRLKGVFFMFLEDLWLQKTRLRIINIMMNYTQPKMERIVGKDGVERLKEVITIYNVPDAEFSDGSKGTLGIQMAKRPADQLSVTDIEAREMAAGQAGDNYKLISITSDYFDNYDIDFLVVPESIESADNQKKEQKVMSKHQVMAAFYPERFAANKDKMFAEFVDIYGESPEEYQKPQPQGQNPLQEGAEEKGGGGGTPLDEGAAVLNSPLTQGGEVLSNPLDQ